MRNDTEPGLIWERRVWVFVTIERAANYTGVSRRTWRRYEANGAPECIGKLLAILAGDLGAIDPAWSGWWLADGRLVLADERHGFTPGEVRVLPWLWARVHRLTPARRAYPAPVVDFFTDSV